MAVKYSPSTKTFYDSDLAYPSLPNDLVSVTDEQHQAWLTQINQYGKDVVLSSGNVASFVDRAAIPITWAEVRAKRNALLASCDFTQLDDVPSHINKADWATYRQALRDLPASVSDPTQITWPTAPSLSA